MTNDSLWLQDLKKLAKQTKYRVEGINIGATARAAVFEIMTLRGNGAVLGDMYSICDEHELYSHNYGMDCPLCNKAGKK